ncbi:MAG: SCO6880 family protein [Acidimicrobiales bacterium]
MAEPEVLYNFGVLTKRYELVSRTASQLAPGIAGLSVGFLMILAGAPLPLPFAPVLAGFWFALGKIPFGRHRGARVRMAVGPLTRYWLLQLAGKTHWVMPAMWLSVAVDPAATRTLDHIQPAEATPVVEPGGAQGNRRGRGTKTRRGRTRREASEQLPPELGRLRWMTLPYDGAEAGLLFERARRHNLLTAVISVSGGDRFVFSGPDEQAAQIFSWGEVLKAMASEGSGLRRLQWVERATPQPSTDQEDWARRAMHDVSPSEWADYLSLQTAIGTAAIHHDVYLGAQVETDTGKEADVLAETASELAQLCEHLTSIGLRPTLLSRREIAAVMRQWADPTALERLALWGSGSIPTSGAGPAARHLGYDTLVTDGYVHRVGQIAAWPRIDVATEWMYPLLSTALAGSVRTVSMHLEAVSTETAFAEVRDARTTGGMAQRKRDEKGIITTDAEERRVDEARSRERELTRGFRQHKVAGLVMVSSPDPETAGRAWRPAERKAVECHLDLREMHARSHEAWAATLPLCRLRFARGLL